MPAEVNIEHFEVLQKKLFKPSTMVIGLFLFVGLIFFRPLVVTTVLIAIGAFSMLYKRYIRCPVDFELCSLTTVAIGSTYGTSAGALVGVMTILSALILNGQFLGNPVYSLLYLLIYAGLGIVSSLFASGPLPIVAGVYFLVADSIFTFIAVKGGGNAGNLMIFLLTHAPIATYTIHIFLPLVKAVL